jgi:hypothetical protein
VQSSPRQSCPDCIIATRGYSFRVTDIAGTSMRCGVVHAAQFAFAFGTHVTDEAQVGAVVSGSHGSRTVASASPNASSAARRSSAVEYQAAPLAMMWNTNPNNRFTPTATFLPPPA